MSKHITINEGVIELHEFEEGSKFLAAANALNINEELFEIIKQTAIAMTEAELKEMSLSDFAKAAASGTGFELRGFDEYAN